jgi:hypothetical protein
VTTVGPPPRVGVGWCVGGQLGGRAGLESRPLFDTAGWVQDFEGCLLLLAELAAAGRDSTPAGPAGGGAAGRRRPPHVVRAARPEWRWRPPAMA